MDFNEFEKKVIDAEEENFEEWDDYPAWKFAENGREHWGKRISELKDAL